MAFREGRFFEAHEAWEEAWLRSTGDERRQLQGLIQVAAACVHLVAGRRAPAERLLSLAGAKLVDAPDDLRGLPAREIAERAAALGTELAKGAVPVDVRAVFSPSEPRRTA